MTDYLQNRSGRIAGRRIRRKVDLTGIFWSDTKERIREGKVVPFVSGAVSYNYLFGQEEYKRLVAKWAETIDYPWEFINLTRAAQFFRMIEDATAARRDFLDFLKEALLDKAEDDGVSSGTIKKVETDKDISFTTLTERLGYINFENQREHPYAILANLPFPIYVTTCYHQFLESALKQAGKQPVSEIYYWREDLEREVSSIFVNNPGFRPSAKQPLVYHLYGRDDYPDSLVLTENDYLDFLVKVAKDMTRGRGSGRIDAQEGLPSVVEAILAESLLLLGYGLEEWDFRVIFRGLIKAKNEARLKDGISIQLEKSNNLSEKAFKRYIEKYFLQSSRLIIYWGDPKSCLLELQGIWDS